jgi:hypothetical protein
MSAGKYDIVIEQGTTFSLPINISANNAPVDLTSYSAKMQVREAPGKPVLVEFNSSLTSNGFIFLTGTAEDRSDGENGNLRLELSAANSEVLPRFSGRYDLEISSGGRTIRLLEGALRVEPEITK